jgi:hypothetical protein
VTISIRSVELPGAKAQVERSGAFVETNPSVDTGTITFASGGTFDAKVTSEHRLYSGEFVPVDKLIPETFTDVGEIYWLPEYMGKFSHVRRHRREFQVRFAGPAKPIRIDIGPQFTGLIMPARKPPGDDE